MKKILSVLIGVLMGVTNVWSGVNNHTIKAYSIVEGGDCNGSITGGTVAVQGSKLGSLTGATYSYVELTDITTYSSTASANIQEYDGYKSWDIKTKYALYAIEKPGYYFTGWYDECLEGNLKYSSISSGEQELDNLLGSTSTTLEFYAIFKPVTVTGVAAVSNISTTDLGGTGTGTVTFDVANAKSANDFTAVVSGAGYSCAITSASSTQVVVTVTYTDQNIHGDPVSSAIVTLTSIGDQANPKQATITASSDLTPTFTKPDNHDYGNAYVGDEKSSEDALNITIKNNAASQKHTEIGTPTGATWQANLDGTNYDQFELINANPEYGEFEVLYKPTTAEFHTATLSISVTYTDANGEDISSGEAQVVTLTGTAEMPQTSEIIFNPTSVDFESQVTGFLGDRKVNVSRLNVGDLTYDWGDTNNASVFGYTTAAGSVTITANPTAPGIYNATLTATGSDTREGETGTTTKSLPVSITVRLQSPFVVGGSNLNGTHYLKWTKVPCATSYVIYAEDKSTEISSSEVANNDTHITHSITSSDTEKTYYVKAISNYGGGTYESWSDKVTVYSDAIGAASTPYLNIYTGMETSIMGPGRDSDTSFPYHPKKQVDLSSTFDANGRALFDQLYIFGETTLTNGDTIIVCKMYQNEYIQNLNAQTPCYIYSKNATDNGYTRTSTITNMNPQESGSKPLSTITANGQKLYFTGHCPYASNGAAAGQVGVVCIEGGADAKVDVYLENLYLHGRFHTSNGSGYYTSSDTVGVELDLWDKVYIPSSASAFVFSSTSTSSSNPFSPTIHLRDSSKLDGGMGRVRASIYGQVARAGIYSAPLQLYVKGNDNDYATTLSIDDKWPIDAMDPTKVEHTNGILDLRARDVARPSIELGNEYSTVNFNGGQIYLKNNFPVAGGEYTCTFAITRRYYTKNVSVVSATLCGMGEDQPYDGYVNFNDGSFYCEKISDGDWSNYSNYYHNKQSLKCPVNTTINGGTFYCDVYACYGTENKGGSPNNKYDNPLVKVSYPINNVPTEPYYLATVDFETIASNLVCQDNTHADYLKTMAQYYNDKDTYGRNSMKAKAAKTSSDPDSVVLMLPYQFTGQELTVEEQYYSWAVCMPSFGATLDGFGEVELGGSSTVKSSETEHTRFFIYGEADEYITEKANNGGYTSPKIEYLTEVTINFENERNNVLNATEYTIDEAQYMLKPITSADQWMLFCPPFDVSNVYILETYNEDRLVTAAEENVSDALLMQAESNLDLMCYLGYYTVFNSGELSFWRVYNEWVNDTTLSNKGSGRVKLTHFTGSNYDANYYLQHSSGNWTWNGAKFTTDWSYLPATDADNANDYYTVDHDGTSYPVIMKKGEIYSMMFPYMYDGYDGYDYWTGKYLVFEGLGKQTIQGTASHNDIRAAMTATPGTAEIRANSTLASVEISGLGAYYQSDGAKKFTLALDDTRSEEILPTAGFVLANPPASSSLPQRIKTIDLLSGEVTYDNNDNQIPTGVPTVGGGNKMFIMAIPGGINIAVTAPQYVKVISSMGAVVFQGMINTAQDVLLPTNGIYVIAGENEVQKILF